MNKKNLTIALLLGLICVSIFMLGCSNSSIQFNRESQATKFIEKFSAPQDTLKKTGGTIIIKEQKRPSSPNMNLGPSDLDFGMPKF